MPTQELQLNPGINVELSQVANQGGWSGCQGIRFRNGMPEKVGGWQHINATPLVGTGRGIHAWADLNSNPYVGIGTDQRLMLFSGGLFYDITPIRKIDNINPLFSTNNGSATVTINDTSNGAAPGDWINILVPVSVGGLIIQGFYQIQSVIDANNYTITAASAATANAVNTGAVPSFTTAMSSPNVTVTLNNHGLAIGGLFAVQITTSVGGITLTGGTTYSVTAVGGVNSFTIVPGASATSGATVAENGGLTQIQYLLPSGNASATAISGYGIGDYGSGDYGLAGNSSVIAPLRQWFLDNWGQDLIGNYGGSPIYVWIPPVAFGNVAIPINTTNYPGATDPPQAVNVSFVAMPQQQMIALGASQVGGGSLDPLLVRFSDVSDFTQWTPTATNQAGSYRIPTGSRIVGGGAGANFLFLWTDVDFWQFNYLSFPLVYGFQRIGQGCGLLSARSYGVYKSNIYWTSQDQFFVFDGSSVQILPCTVWDKLFLNLNKQQIDKVFCAVNSDFGEVTWYYPSATGNGEVDSYITYSAFESQLTGNPIWYYGSLVRTCWTDVNVYGGPLGTDTNGFLQQHEVGYDADGSVLVASITSGYMPMSDSTMFWTIKRLIPDMILTGGMAPFNSIQITLNLLDYPNDVNNTSNPVQTVGPFTWTPQTPEFIQTVCRGRLMSITISSNSMGVFWRLGGFRYEAAPAGRR